MSTPFNDGGFLITAVCVLVVTSSGKCFMDLCTDASALRGRFTPRASLILAGRPPACSESNSTFPNKVAPPF